MSKRRNAAQAVSFANRHPNITAAVAIILVILITAFAIFCILNPERFKKWLGLDKADGADGLPVGSVVEVAEADLSIHFLELGNKYTGDCTLIKCGNTEVLIDAGSRTDSAVTIKNYVDKYCTDGILEYVIATHAHQDHIAGFVGNK